MINYLQIKGINAYNLKSTCNRHCSKSAELVIYYWNNGSKLPCLNIIRKGKAISLQKIFLNII